MLPKRLKLIIFFH